MASYRRRVEIVEAQVFEGDGKGYPLGTDTAKVLKDRGYETCPNCNGDLKEHAFRDNDKGGYIFCPGDVVVKDVAGRVFPMKPDIFELYYEPIQLAT